ncbi:FkbM family methyltransferase [Sphingobium yanoikuyae]|uniref:FkbM family methyltransferase n=1 Tax=Sphingobium yanoikuyae TaxID=13690 RepID=UPI003F08CF36
MGIRSRAQNFEDVMLWRAVGGVQAGFFIDVGAQHPIKDSVSKIFSEKGWGGIHVEPTPEYANMLREDRPSETVISAAISAKIGTISFFAIANSGLSTGDRDIAEAHAAAGHPYRKITVPTLSLDDLLTLAPSDDIHWLKIDVEGMEQDVLESWRLSPRRPWIVLIEANLPGSQVPSHEKWEALILAKGYHATYYDGLNRFYVSDEHPELDQNFKLPPNIFDGFQFDPSSDHAVLIQRLHKAEVEALETNVAGLEVRLADMRQETDALSRQWRNDTEQRITDIRREAAVELANTCKREASRTEAIVARIAARERDTATAAAAKQSELEQQIVAFRNSIDAERALAKQRETELLGTIEDLRVAAAAQMTLRTEVGLKEAMLRADLQTRLEEAKRREVEAAAASKRTSERLVHDAELKIAALETQIAEVNASRVCLEHDLADARDRIVTLRDVVAAREKELLTQSFETANRVREIEAARFEARLADERTLLRASEDRIAAAMRQLSDMQRALEQAREDAAEQERAAHLRMQDVLERLQVQAKQDVAALRADARHDAERLRVENEALLADTQARLSAAEHMMADRAEAYHATILEQAEAFRVEIARIIDASAECEQEAHSRIEQVERREQDNVAAVRLEMKALLAHLKRSDAQMGAVKASRSWKLSAPLRWLLRETAINRHSLEYMPASPPSRLIDAAFISHHVESWDIATMPFQPVESVADFLAQPASDFVNQSFRLLLGRDPVLMERKARESALYLGRGRIAMLAEIYHSPEANQYRHDQREQGSDEEFVERAYQYFLRRSADPEGLAHYTNLLQRKSRVAVEAELSTSNEATGKRSLLGEIDRMAAAYRRSRRWWRRFGRSRWEQQIRNIENEAILANILRRDTDQREHMLQTIEAMREHIIRQVDTTRVAMRQDIARMKEEGHAEMRAMILRSQEAVDAMREQGGRALIALDDRQKAFDQAARELESKLRSDLDQARIETQHAIVLLRDDAQLRYERIVESQRAERAAAAPSIQKVNMAQVGSHARHILQRMRTLATSGGEGHA